VHVLFAACEGAPAELYLQSRGWSEEDWADAVRRLATRNLLLDDGTPTAQGRALHAEVERRTDELAAEPYARMRDEDVRRLVTDLTPAGSTDRSQRRGHVPQPDGPPGDDGRGGDLTPHGAGRDGRAMPGRATTPTLASGAASPPPQR
jgi:hypothetical protein